MYISGLMISKSKYKSSSRRSFPGSGEYEFAFKSDIVKLLLKTNGGRDRRPIFCVVWSALIVGGWVVVVCTRKSCLGLAEITSSVFLVLFKDGGCMESPRFHLFVSDVNQRIKDGGISRFSCVAPGVERPSSPPPIDFEKFQFPLDFVEQFVEDLKSSPPFRKGGDTMNTVEALIPFNEEHQGLLKLHVPLGWGGLQCEGKNGAISKRGNYL